MEFCGLSVCGVWLELEGNSGKFGKSKEEIFLGLGWVKFREVDEKEAIW